MFKVITSDLQKMTMLIKKIQPQNKNGDFNVIIEIAMNSSPIKYEFHKEIEALVVDRFMQVSMSYPYNYGFIPNTLSDDGDPTDVLVITQYPLTPKSVITVRLVGVLVMEDESGKDEKLLAVPISKLDGTFDSIQNIDDVSQIVKNRINHFFKHYKELEQNKWVKIIRWDNATTAKNIVKKAMKKFQ